jgi:hypothetical protein
MVSFRRNSADLNGQMDLSSAGLDRYNGDAYQFKRELHRGLSGNVVIELQKRA